MMTEQREEAMTATLPKTAKPETELLRLLSDKAQQRQMMKALGYLASFRVAVISSTPFLIVLSVQGSDEKPYTVRYGVEGGRLITECSCAHGLIYGDSARCCHLLIARMLHSARKD